MLVLSSGGEGCASHVTLDLVILNLFDPVDVVILMNSIEWDSVGTL